MNNAATAPKRNAVIMQVGGAMSGSSFVVTNSDPMAAIGPSKR
jgi:hypothetical protein